MTPNRQQGFTLIELLVVIAIIVAVTATAVASLQPPALADLQRDEARRLAARMQLAHDRSLLLGTTFGLHIEGDRYRFLRHDGESWQVETGSQVLRAYELPEGLELVVEMNGLESVIGNGAPQIHFLAGGIIEPEYRISLYAESGEVTYHVHSGDYEWIRLTQDNNAAARVSR